eukprot:scaffold69055_cov35-Tisochrysis_lutea.AAC.3
MAMRSSNMTEAVRALLKIHVCPHMDSSEREDSPTTFRQDRTPVGSVCASSNVDCKRTTPTHAHRHKGLFDQARLPSTQISGRAALPSD